MQIIFYFTYGLMLHELVQCGKQTETKKKIQLSLSYIIKNYSQLKNADSRSNSLLREENTK